MSDNSATFSGLWDFFMACCDIYKLTWCSTSFCGLQGGGSVFCIAKSELCEVP